MDIEPVICTQEKSPQQPQNPKKSGKLIYWILIAVFSTVFIVSGVVVGDYYIGYYQHQQMMEDIRNLHTKDPNEQIIRPTAPITNPGTTLPSIGGTVPTVPTQVTVPTTVPQIPTVSTQPSIPDGTGNSDSQPSIPDTQPSAPSIPGTEATQPVIPTTPPTSSTQEPTVPTTVPQSTVPIVPPIVDKQILAEMKGVYELNNDVVGWIQIPGTAIDYPVMHTHVVDYYLYRNIYKQDDNRGSIYAEEECDVFRPSDVVSLHGHHMRDGTMFNNICNFKYKDYFQSHPYVYFDTLYERRTYQVVLVFRTNGEPHATYPFFPFHVYTDFIDENDFNDFMASARSLALQQSNVKVNYGDKLLCLSTCDYTPYPNGRMVLLCKLIK